MPKVIYSFSFKLLPINATSDRLVIDVRTWRNPYRRKGLRYKTGLDPEVCQDIENIPDFQEKWARLLARVKAFKGQEVFIGCTAGHHRSVYLAERLGKELNLPVRHLVLESEQRL